MTKPSLAVTQPDGTRKYVHPLTGETVPSVTTVMKWLPQQDWKVPWAVTMTAQHMCVNWMRLSREPHEVRIREAVQAHEIYAGEKARIGDIVHDLVDCWSTGRPFPDVPKEINSYINKFIDFLTDKRPRFIENETTFWSRTYGYAGTGDFIIEIDGKTLLADLKTGRSLHPEVGLQVSALAHADFILRPDGTEEELPHIDGLAALHLRPRSWKLVHLRESEECFAGFLAAQSVMKWSQGIAPLVLEGKNERG